MWEFGTKFCIKKDHEDEPEGPKDRPRGSIMRLRGMAVATSRCSHQAVKVDANDLHPQHWPR